MKNRLKFKEFNFSSVTDSGCRSKYRIILDETGKLQSQQDHRSTVLKTGSVTVEYYIFSFLFFPVWI